MKKIFDLQDLYRLQQSAVESLPVCSFVRKQKIRRENAGGEQLEGFLIIKVSGEFRQRIGEIDVEKR